MDNLKFRPITRDDYELAQEFRRATVLAATGDETAFDTWFPPEKPYSVMLDTLRAFDEAACVFVEINDIPVGQLDLRIDMTDDQPAGYVSSIYLMPEWRGQGIGELMEGYAVGFFRKHGADWASLRTNPKQDKVMEFYQKLGWEVVGEARFGMVVMAKGLYA